MPFTLVAFYESQTATALANIAAIADPHLRREGDNLFIPTFAPQLAGFHFMGADLTQARILSPSLRAELNLDVEPVDYVDEPASPSAFHDLFESPIPLEANEPLNTQMIEGTGPSAATALIWLSDGPITKVSGRIYTIRATNTSTLTANAWTNGELTFAQTLPAGRYQCVGMRAQSAGLRAARCYFPEHKHRAGVIGYDADADLESPRFRYGNAGVFGEFDSRSPPSIDFLSASADTSQVVHLDIIPLD